MDERVFPTVVDWRTSAPKDGMPTANSYSAADVKTGTRPRAAHEVSLLTVTTNRVIDVEDPVATATSSKTPSVMESHHRLFKQRSAPYDYNKGGRLEDQDAGRGCPRKGTTTTEIPTKGVATTEFNDGTLTRQSGFGPTVVKFRARGFGLLKKPSPVHGLVNQTKELETHARGSRFGMRRPQEDRNAELSQGVTGEERIKARFEEFKKYEDNKIADRSMGHWAIGHIALTVMKCAESSEIRQVFANVVSVGLAKESDTGEDAPQWIRDLCPSSSQLKIPIYPEVRALEDPWAVKEEGLAILLTDAGTQTQRSEDEASPRLFSSSSLCTVSTAVVRYVGIPISAVIKDHTNSPWVEDKDCSALVSIESHLFLYALLQSFKCGMDLSMTWLKEICSNYPTSIRASGPL
ncbi:hypothetical protein Tco_0393473 [Tanacetum coccineum]